MNNHQFFYQESIVKYKNQIKKYITIFSGYHINQY